MKTSGAPYIQNRFPEKERGHVIIWKIYDPLINKGFIPTEFFYDFEYKCWWSVLYETGLASEGYAQRILDEGLPRHAFVHFREQV